MSPCFEQANSWIVLVFVQIRLSALNEDSSEESDPEPTQESIKQAKVRRLSNFFFVVKPKANCQQLYTNVSWDLVDAVMDDPLPPPPPPTISPPPTHNPAPCPLPPPLPSPHTYTTLWVSKGNSVSFIFHGASSILSQVCFPGVNLNFQVDMKLMSKNVPFLGIWQISGTIPCHELIPSSEPLQSSPGMLLQPRT